MHNCEVKQEMGVKGERGICFALEITEIPIVVNDARNLGHVKVKETDAHCSMNSIQYVHHSSSPNNVRASLRMMAPWPSSATLGHGVPELLY